MLRIKGGSVTVEGGNLNVLSDDGAGGTVDTENLVTNGDNRLTGNITMTLLENQLNFVTSDGSNFSMEMNYPLANQFFLSTYNNKTGRYDFVQTDFVQTVNDLIDKRLSNIEYDINVLKSGAFVRQDANHSVTEISAVTKYPDNPREGVFYLLQET